MNSPGFLQKILIVGGTFCPPHLAHIAIASAVQHQFAFDDVIFVPCKEPVLDKVTNLSTTHRVAMLRLALQPYPDFTLDLCEINRNAPSYMVTTLTDFRHRFGEHASITLLIGMDNFLQLLRWHHWESILTVSHLLVVDRAGITQNIPAILQTLLTEHQPTAKNNVSTIPYGTIERYDAGQYEISSTKIRTGIQTAIKTDVLAPSVREYIVKHKLFM
ncbi:MAG: nicotinate (nicotinamide) nucleotide adenylyltransferase [Legionellaceae bacterium]|nr:nicotinate (nicotinamide) nucleotide adenylyltransferase [Legionellaceae bacterium]